MNLVLNAKNGNWFLEGVQRKSGWCELFPDKDHLVRELCL